MPAPSAAVTAALTLARSLGIEGTPRLLADRSHTVLAIDPHPIVARVAMSTSTTRVGMEWLDREVAVARHLDAAGVPVTRPCGAIDPGPHEVDGFVVSFWDLEHELPGLDAHAAGMRLAEVHRALASFDRTRLPIFGVFHEAASIVPRACTNGVLPAGEANDLVQAFARAEAIVDDASRRSTSFQAVHGDAHFGNVFSTPRGPLFTDWEDACIAPIEWDLATLRSRFETFGEEGEWLAAAMLGYDVAFDEGLVADLVAVRNLQVVPWLAVFAERLPELAERARARLARVARGGPLRGRRRP